MHSFWTYILDNFIVLNRLRLSSNEISDTLKIMKTNTDAQYKLNQLMSQEYQNIVDEYKKTWHEYRVSTSINLEFVYIILESNQIYDYKQAIYEKFPLAKARNASKINLEKLKINYMIMSYKKAEMMTIIKQRRRINWIRTRCKIIEFATMMLERLKLEEKFTKLKVNVKYHKKELQSIEAEVCRLY